MSGFGVRKNVAVYDERRNSSRVFPVEPGAVDRDTLAEMAGTSPTSSSFANNLGALRSLGLIDYPTRGEVVALPVLFMEGT